MLHLPADRPKVCSARGAPWKKSHHPPEATRTRCPFAATAAADVDRQTSFDEVMQVEIEIGQPQAARTRSSVGISGSRLCDVVDVEKRGVASHGGEASAF